MNTTFFGDKEFPIEWEDGQKELFWVHDDLHIPNPISPMFADIGGWWLNCDYMFRRFGTPFASDWLVKIINGYVYTAAIPAKSDIRAEATEYGARYMARTPVDPAYANQIGAYLGWTLPYYADKFLDWWSERLRPEMERNLARFDAYDYEGASLLDLAVFLEEAIDMHDRHWQIHWLLNFSQFSATLALNAAIAEAKGDGDHGGLQGRLQASTENRNWDSIKELWKMKEYVKADGGEHVGRESVHEAYCDRRARRPEGDRGRPCIPRQAARALPQCLRLQVHVGARILLQDVEGEPGAGRRGDSWLP